MTKSTKACDDTIISEGTIVPRDPEQAVVDRILHLLEGKIRTELANVTKEKYIIRHPQSGLVLDVKASGRSNGTVVQLWERNGTEAQVWTLERGGLIVNPQSAKCLNAQSYELGGSSSVVIYDPQANGSYTSQAWEYTQDGMIIHCPTGKALTKGENGKVCSGPRKGPNDLSQQWALVPLSFFE